MQNKEQFPGALGDFFFFFCMFMDFPLGMQSACKGLQELNPWKRNFLQGSS